MFRKFFRMIYRLLRGRPMLFRMTEANQFVQRFEAITKQAFADWSAYEALEAENREDKKDKTNDSYLVGLALDSCIACEIMRQIEERGERFQATYVRDLAQLLVDLRTAML